MGETQPLIGAMSQEFSAPSETESEESDIGRYTPRDSARSDAQRRAAGTPASSALLPDFQSDEEVLDFEDMTHTTQPPLTGEPPEDTVEMPAERPNIGDTVQKPFTHSSGNWLYEGRIVDIDETGAQPIYNIEFSNGHRESMSLKEVSENRIIDTSQFDERNVGVEISTDNILPEGSRRNRGAMLSKPRADTRQAFGAKKSEYKNGILIPKSHAQAMRSPEREEWLKAEQKEIDAMRIHEVFEQVDYIPQGKTPLRFMVLYTV
ncbi:MAG: hypothetical protein AAFY15_09220, partial [Cyanobacteria bacterium J06648_11]